MSARKTLGALGPVPAIQTRRLRLLPFQAADIDGVHALWNRPEVRRYMMDGAEVPPERTREMQEQSEAAFAAGRYGLWIARKRSAYSGPDGDQPLGISGYWPFHEPPVVELLWALEPTSWGRGLATEMAGALLRYGFEQLHLNEVQASMDAVNKASVRVAERLGMSLRQRSEGASGDLLHYAVSRGEQLSAGGGR